MVCFELPRKVTAWIVYLAEKNAKYEELLKRDRDMQTFIDSFENRKSEAEEKNAAIERHIVEILDHMRVSFQSGVPLSAIWC